MVHVKYTADSNKIQEFPHLHLCFFKLLDFTLEYLRTNEVQCQDIRMIVKVKREEKKKEGKIGICGEKRIIQNTVCWKMDEMFEEVI